MELQFNLLDKKVELLEQYMQHYNKLKIGSISTTLVQRKHFQAAHVYFRVLEYFSTVDSDKIEIDWLLVEDVLLELEKSLYLLDTKYYA